MNTDVQIPLNRALHEIIEHADDTKSTL